MTDAAWAPSDLNKLAPGSAVRVGGRVHHEASGGFCLSDALAAVRVQLHQDEPRPPDRALVVIDALYEQGLLRDGRVLSVQPPQGPQQGETQRLLARGVGANLLQRARCLALVRSWFADRGFAEIDAPQRVPSPGLDLHLDAFEAGGQYLITSPEYQMKRLLAGGMPRIYALVHCFRDGESGAWHNPEFTMLEWYRAFAGIDHVMHDTEQIVQHVAKGLLASTHLRVDGRDIDLATPFDRITVLQAFERYAGAEAEQVLQWAQHDEDRYFAELVERVEPELAASPRPVFLTDFPAPQASLARLRPGDPRVCERFELYIAGHELCNGFGELTDAREQRWRLERDVATRQRLGKPVYPIDERFLDALEEGMPPAGGNALGIDRLVALCLGASNIGDVLPFPASWL